jgi:hypothetical protein
VENMGLHVGDVSPVGCHLRTSCKVLRARSS